MFLTNNRDANILILSKLDFLDLRNVLLVNRNTAKYNDSVLWFHHSKQRSDFDLMEKTIKRSWKDFSLSRIECYDLQGENPKKGLALSAFKGQRDLVDFFVSKGANDWDWAMTSAAKGGHRELVDFFISQGAHDWDNALYSSARGGYRELVDFFISQGANDWNEGLYYSSLGGHRDLVDFFITKGANSWNWARAGAERGGHIDLIQFFTSFQNRAQWKSHMHTN